MKRLVFSILMILALTAGASYAQSTINTTAPGPTQQQEPGQTNNNLPNPGNPQTELGDQQPLQEEGTVEGTATESMATEPTATDTTTGTMSTGSTGLVTETETEPATGMDVDVDTGAEASGAMDVDVNSTADADTSATGIDETGSLDQETSYAAGDSDDLPATGSELPLVALIGFLALAAAFVVRRF